MTTMLATVTNIRRMLKDRPVRDKIVGAVAVGAQNFTPTDASLYQIGQVWEHDDGSAGWERRRILSVDTATPSISAEKAYDGSADASHAPGSYINLDPRFPGDTIAQAVNTVLDVDLYSNDLFEIVEHQIVSSDTTDTYNAPTGACERFLNVYQRSSTDPNEEPRYLVNFSRKLYNADSSLYASGKFAVIRQNYGIAGTDVYYVNCAHKLAIGTLSLAQERIVQTRAAYYLLTWSDINRHAGPTNQGDRTVQPLSMTRLAQFYKVESERMMKEEASYLKEFIHPAGGKRFVREGIR